MYIGIDGGGTKTKMVSYDDDGNIGQEIVLPTVHILSQTPKKCIEILKDRKSTRLNSSHRSQSRMPSSA